MPAKTALQEKCSFRAVAAFKQDSPSVQSCLRLPGLTGPAVGEAVISGQNLRALPRPSACLCPAGRCCQPPTASHRPQPGGSLDQNLWSTGVGLLTPSHPPCSFPRDATHPASSTSTELREKKRARTSNFRVPLPEADVWGASGPFVEEGVPVCGERGPRGLRNLLSFLVALYLSSLQSGDKRETSVGSWPTDPASLTPGTRQEKRARCLVSTVHFL